MFSFNYLTHIEQDLHLQFAIQQQVKLEMK